MCGEVEALRLINMARNLKRPKHCQIVIVTTSFLWRGISEDRNLRLNAK